MGEARYPAAAAAAVEDAIVAKLRLSTSELTVMNMLGGFFIAAGALLAVVVAGGATGLYETDPGLQRLVSGAVFPVGFIAVVLTGAGLFTSDCATTTVPMRTGRSTPAAVARLLAVAYLANAVGAVAMAVLANAGGLLDPGQPWIPYLVSMSTGKVSHGWPEMIAEGIIANALVCTAAWQAYVAKDTVGKILGIWFPVMAFVALGAEHSIANLFFIPAAKFAGADIGVTEFLWNNLLPATLGNWVGGALVIGAPLAFLYARKADRADVSPPRSNVAGN